MEGVALYYQYELNYGPCVLCIHIRLWLVVIMSLSILLVLMRESRLLRSLLHLGITATTVGMIHTSWQLLGTERGWIQGTCDFDIGLPAWLDVQKWWPTVFEIWEPCGYTPELLFDVTMAEALLVISGLLCALSVLLFFSGLRR